MSDSDDEREWSIHDLIHAPSPPSDPLHSSRLSITGNVNNTVNNSRRHSSPRFSIGGNNNNNNNNSNLNSNSSHLTSPVKNRRAIGTGNLSPRSRRLQSLEHGETLVSGPLNRDRLVKKDSRDRLFSIGSGVSRRRSNESNTSAPIPPPPPLTNTSSFPLVMTEPGLVRKRVEFSQNTTGSESNINDYPIDPYGYNTYDRNSSSMLEDEKYDVYNDSMPQISNDDDFVRGVDSSEIEDNYGSGGVEEEKRDIVTSMSRSEWDPTSDSAKPYPIADRYSKRPSTTTRALRQRSNSTEGSEDSQSRRNRLNSHDQSLGGISDYVDDTAGEGEDESINEDHRGRKPVIFLGFKLPSWFSKRPSWSRVASFIVTRAPCFWCYGCQQSAPTERTVLARLNTLCACLASFQIASFMWLMIVTFSSNIVARKIDPRQGQEIDDENYYYTDEINTRILEVVVNLWNVNSFLYILGVEAIIIVAAALFTIRTIRNVNLVGAICYLWSLMWLLPVEILFVIGLFDYFRVTDVWIKHWWRDPTMAWFRRTFCRPKETYNTLCTVPIVPDENKWCMDLYNSTACTSIRNDAQTHLGQFMLSYYYFNAAWGLVLVCLLMLNVNRLESMITRPLIQKSRESNVPAWLALPTIGCLLIGTIYAFAESSGLNTRSNTEASWIGPLYIASGGLFLLAALLGWHISAFSILNTRDKRHKIVAITIFIIVIGSICVLLATIFAASITFSINLIELPITSGERGDIACFLDQNGSCTNCQNEIPDSLKCPEWTISDVTKVIQSQAKGSATLSAIFMMYGVAALRFGFGLRSHVTMYQIDYV